MDTPRRILCAVDFTECSQAALDYALMLAHLFDAKMDLVHGWELSAAMVPPLFVGPAPSSSVIAERTALDAMSGLLDRLPPSARARVTPHVVWGNPSSVVVEQAKECSADLIVLGTHGRRGLSRVLLGSVAEHVVRHAPCPVLTVRPAGIPVHASTDAAVAGGGAAHGGRSQP